MIHIIINSSAAAAAAAAATVGVAVPDGWRRRIALDIWPQRDWKKGEREIGKRDGRMMMMTMMEMEMGVLGSHLHIHDIFQSFFILSFMHARLHAPCYCRKNKKNITMKK